MTAHLSASKPNFSPDGEQILFECFVTASKQDVLCVMNAEGALLGRTFS